MNSPIAPLLENIKAAPYKVAPEREAELREINERHKFIIYPIKEDKFTFEVGSLTKRIVVGIPTLERIWAYLYGHLYITYLLQDTNGGDVIDLNLTKETREVSTLLSWATSADVASQYSSWPQNVPTPSSDPQDINIKAANELFLMAIGWMILHEIAHIELNQKPPSCDNESIQQEQEADNWASAWIMEKWEEFNPSERVFIKRTLGITFAISIASAFELHTERTSKTHPNIIDRYLNFLDKYVPEEDSEKAHKKEIAWLAAIASLNTHISNSYSRSFNLKGKYQNFREHLLDIKQNLVQQ